MVAPTAYLDFDVAVSRRGDQLDVRVLGSPAGETGSVLSPLPAQVLAPLGEVRSRALRALRPVRPAPDPVDDRLVGSELFGALFAGAVLDRFRASTARATMAGAGLRLMLRCDSGTDVLPWELLMDPTRSRFLALDPRTPVIRCTETPTQEPAATSGEAVRVLVAISSPEGTPPLDATAERAAIGARLAPLTVGGALVVDVLEDASLEGIRHAIDEHEVHVFHYIGHGTPGPDGRSALVLTGADGTQSLRSADELAGVLAAATGLRLCVLNSCHGSLADPTDPFAGAGATLVRAGVPAVVAMRTEVTDDAAIALAAALYESLATAAPVEHAVTQARIALAAADGPVAREWPVVALHLASSLPAGLRAGPLPRLDEDVEFTVARPERLLAEEWQALLVLAHHGTAFLGDDGRTVDQPAQVRRRVADFYGSDKADTTVTPSTLALPRGTGLVVAPDLPDSIDCDPPTAAMAWTGEIAETRFLLRPRAALAGTTVEGWVRVFCGPLVIAETRLELAVTAGVESSATIDTPVRPYRRIFPCFAVEDTAVVEGVAAVAEALGDSYTDRVVSAQQEGGPTGWLLPLIAEADVFQLFWSTHSMRSVSCREQWEQAVATAREGFVRPLYWEQPFPRSEGLPPPELATLRFIRLPAPPPETPSVPAPSWPAPSVPAPAGPTASTPEPTRTTPITEGPPTGEIPPWSVPSETSSSTAGTRSGEPAASIPPGRLGGMSVLSALVGFGLIAIGWHPGQGLVPDDASPWDLLGLAFLALAVILGCLFVVALVRRRRRRRRR